jgi:hypothetical protein
VAGVLFCARETRRVCLPKRALVRALPPKTPPVRAKLASLMGVTCTALRILPGRRPVMTYEGVQGSSRTPLGASICGRFGNRQRIYGGFGSRPAGILRAGVLRPRLLWAACLGRSLPGPPQPKCPPSPSPSPLGIPSARPPTELFSQCRKHFRFVVRCAEFGAPAPRWSTEGGRSGKD